MAKLKSFEQFVSEMDRAEEIETTEVELGQPQEKDVEETEEVSEACDQCNEEPCVCESEEAVEESEETEEVEEDRAEEIAKDMAEKGEPKSLAEMLTELYEGSCKNEAKAYEEDAHDEHTIESYMKENAALVAALAAKSLKEMKEDYAIEAYEAACNEMIESYTKKMNEMKEMDSATGTEEEASEE